MNKRFIYSGLFLLSWFFLLNSIKIRFYLLNVLLFCSYMYFGVKSVKNVRVVGL